MKTYQMSPEESVGWEHEDARTRDDMRQMVRTAARERAIAADEMHEIVTPDGIVVDTVYPSSIES